MKEIYHPETDPGTFVPSENEAFYFISPTFKIIGAIYQKEVHAQLIIAGNSFQFFTHAEAALQAMLIALEVVNKKRETFKATKPDMKMELMSAEKIKEDAKRKKTSNKKK